MREDGTYYEKGKDTAFEGWMKQVAANGSVQSLEMIQGGMKNGASLTWHQNGTRSMEGEFKNNQSDGAWAGWHQNGEKAGVRNYAEGVLHGEFSQTWPNGQSMMEGNYKGGNQDGEWVQWHENGQQQSEILYEDGKILGASYWNSNGDPVASRPDGSPAGPLR